MQAFKKKVKLKLRRGIKIDFRNKLLTVDIQKGTERE